MVRTRHAVALHTRAPHHMGSGLHRLSHSDILPAAAHRDSARFRGFLAGDIPEFADHTMVHDGRLRVGRRIRTVTWYARGLVARDLLRSLPAHDRIQRHPEGGRGANPRSLVRNWVRARRAHGLS